MPLHSLPAPLRAGDLLRDLDKELSDYAKRRQAKRAAAGGGGAAASGGPPKSLWEELADIGGETLDEFLDFLEQVGACFLEEILVANTASVLSHGDDGRDACPLQRPPPGSRLVTSLP